MALNIYAFERVILLAGLVKQTAIMMIKFAMEVEQKTPKAIFQGCLIRFRPLMMTILSALLGALPIAIGSRKSPGLTCLLFPPWKNPVTNHRSNHREGRG